RHRAGSDARPQGPHPRRAHRQPVTEACRQPFEGACSAAGRARQSGADRRAASARRASGGGLDERSRLGLGPTRGTAHRITSARGLRGAVSGCGHRSGCVKRHKHGGSMKLLMFRHDGQPRLGALRPGHEDEVVDLSEVARDLLAVIDAGERGLEHVRKAAAGAKSGIALKEVALLPPIDAPRGNIIAMGRNYQKHAEETAVGGDVKPPTIFTKAITSITGPYDEIPIDAS